MEDTILRLKPDYLSIEIDAERFGDYVIEVNLHNKEIFGGFGVGLSVESCAAISITLGWVLHDPPRVEGEPQNRGHWISDRFLNGLSDNFSASLRYVGAGMTIVYDRKTGKEYKAFEVGVSTPQAGFNRVYSVNVTKLIEDIYFDISRRDSYDQYTILFLLRQKIDYHIKEAEKETKGRLGDFIRSPYYHA